MGNIRDKVYNIIICIYVSLWGHQQPNNLKKFYVFYVFFKVCKFIFIRKLISPNFNYILADKNIYNTWFLGHFPNALNYSIYNHIFGLNFMVKLSVHINNQLVWDHNT